ncbi:MAG: hypothetical protein D3920_12710 [Candidatus Electrothrix sp. AW2]|nr:hypothetical protein [Candidatus Electrothrix gigas]
MNLKLNAKQKREIATAIDAAGFDASAFSYSTQKSECVSMYVRHAYDCLNGYEPTIAQALHLQADPSCFFTFERDDKGIFRTTVQPELEVGRNLQATQWQGILTAFSNWLKVLKIEIEDRGLAVTPPRTLSSMLKDADFAGIKKEFERAEMLCDSDAPAALTASCAAIEAACKRFISVKGLELPANKSILPLWKVVRNSLFPAVESHINQDLAQICGGLSSVINGIGAARTHAGSAHGREATDDVVGASEARLSVHAAHAVVLYLLERMK